MIARGYNESAVREHDIVLICSIRSNNARDMGSPALPARRGPM